MHLSRPTFAIWSISTLLVVAVIAVKYFSVSIPALGEFVDGGMFEALLIGYILLWIGTVFRGV